MVTTIAPTSTVAPTTTSVISTTVAPTTTSVVSTTVRPTTTSIISTTIAPTSTVIPTTTNSITLPPIDRGPNYILNGNFEISILNENNGWNVLNYNYVRSFIKQDGTKCLSITGNNEVFQVIENLDTTKEYIFSINALDNDDNMYDYYIRILDNNIPTNTLIKTSINKGIFEFRYIPTTSTIIISIFSNLTSFYTQYFDDVGLFRTDYVPSTTSTIAPTSTVVTTPVVSTSTIAPTSTVVTTPVVSTSTVVSTPVVTTPVVSTIVPTSTIKQTTTISPTSTIALTSTVVTTPVVSTSTIAPTSTVVTTPVVSTSTVVSTPVVTTPVVSTIVPTSTIKQTTTISPTSTIALTSTVATTPVVSTSQVTNPLLIDVPLENETVTLESNDVSLAIVDDVLKVTVNTDTNIDTQTLVQTAQDAILETFSDVVINSVQDGETLNIYINDKPVAENLQNIEHFQTIDYSKIKYINYIFNTKHKKNISNLLKRNLKNNINTQTNKIKSSKSIKKTTNILFYIIPILILILILIFIGRKYFIKNIPEQII